MAKKIAIAAALLVAIGAGWWFSRDYLTFAAIKEGQAQLQAYYEANRVLMLAGYFLGYVAITALSLPGALIMTLAAGALFGFVAGSLLVSFASSIGATLAFLVARYLVGDAVQKRYADQLAKFNAKFSEEGPFYLFALRLIPVVPFFLINILMGLTRIKAVTFYWVSQLGMLAGTLVYVNAGTQIAKIDAPADIASPALLGSFVLLGIVPLVAKKAVAVLRARRGPAAGS
ncbi:MAG: TVP38/TMEM64 family protein [Betaproteobacteria bacterium AqS2]|uniref:TVP38/TMEM64 family protein n=1 Tax=Candidatus Amphirhobacter heronislandensis TaxID=1732024 RepID=A0A930UDI5_9GAMM|nr:TVP38/TMEM64 family protein [Betaproteobacteria bacterium AqS2]